MNSDVALEIYKTTSEQQQSDLALHHQYSKLYFTLITTLLVISLGVVYNFINAPWALLAPTLACMLNSLFCYTAISVCNRYYLTFLESITIKAKLEPLVGLTEARPDEMTRSELPAFPADKFIIPERWLRDRKEYTTAKAFVEGKMKAGANRLIRLSFYFLLFLNILVIVGITARIIDLLATQ